MLEAAVTSGDCATASPMAVGNGVKPSVDVTRYCALTCLSIASRFDPFMPFARTEMNVTSARPIISAAAVAAVRPGARREFSPASLSVAGSNETSGRSLGWPRFRTRCTSSIDEPDDEEDLHPDHADDAEVHQHRAEPPDRDREEQEQAGADHEQKEDASDEEPEPRQEREPWPEQPQSHEPGPEPRRVDEVADPEHEPLRDRADAGSDPRHEPRRDQRDADEEQQAADGERAEPDEDASSRCRTCRRRATRRRSRPRRARCTACTSRCVTPAASRPL